MAEDALSWKKTLAYWALFGVMLAYFVAFERRPAPPPETETKRQRVLPIFGDEVKAIALRRDALEVRCERRDKRWEMVKPAGVKVPSDLVATLVDTLTEKQEGEIVDAAPKETDLAAFGLAEPSAVIDFEVAGGRKVKMQLGSRNPSRTAVYVRTSLSPNVILVGLNIQYYTDLLFDLGAAHKS